MVAKVEWHPGELVPRVGFIVTNLLRPVERVVAFYNQRGKAEQYIKEGKNAIRWTRLSCRSFRNNAVTTLREKLVKIGAKVVRHGRYVTFQTAEVVIPRALMA